MAAEALLALRALKLRRTSVVYSCALMFTRGTVVERFVVIFSVCMRARVCMCSWMQVGALLDLVLFENQSSGVL